MNAGDRVLMAKIGNALATDRSLSTYAHRIKITSDNGIVTLEGRVQSVNEIHSIATTAATAAGGSENVVNHLAI